MTYKTLRVLEHMEYGSSSKEYQNRIGSENAHTIDFSVNGFPCFFVENKEIRDLVLHIHKCDKSLIKICDALPEEAIEQFSTRCLIDEILLSNNIEGVHSTRKEIGDSIEHRGSRRFWGIVNKYLMLSGRENIPLQTCLDVRKVYDDLVLEEVSEASSENVPDGEIFRKGPVSVISPLQKDIHQGLYPEPKIIEAMNKALKYLNDDEEELLYRIAVFHYLLGYIHPFYDGNGRLNRFISSYMLSKEFEPVYSYRISYSIKENQSEYYNAFKECNDPRNRGELTPFVMFFLKILNISMENLLYALSERKEKWDKYSVLVAKLPHGLEYRYFSLYTALLKAELFSETGIGIKALANSVDVSEPTLRKMLRQLDQIGVLRVDKTSRSFKYGIKFYSIDSVLSKGE